MIIKMNYIFLLWFRTIQLLRVKSVHPYLQGLKLFLSQPSSQQYTGRITIPSPHTKERNRIGKGGSNFACVCWRLLLACLDFMLKSAIIVYYLSPFRLSICVQSKEALENLFFFSLNTCYQLFFSGKYQICIQHYPSGVSNPLPLMDNSALYHVYSMESDYYIEAKINVTDRLTSACRRRIKRMKPAQVHCCS